MLPTDKLKDKTIGEIVSVNYRAAGVFSEFGIDFCCGGGISVEKACAKKNINPKAVLNELEKIMEDSIAETDQNYKAWEPGFLISHIERTHHNFVRRKTPEITKYAAKVAKVHGDRHPENVKIYERFLDVSHALVSHLESEERRVFPLIQEVFSSRMDGEPISDDLAETLKEELRLMEGEHEHAGDAMKEIRELSNGYRPPEDACATYRILYQNLEGFEQDLHKHVHLENNILFKKAENLLRSDFNG